MAVYGHENMKPTVAFGTALGPWFPVRGFQTIEFCDIWATVAESLVLQAPEEGASQGEEPCS